MHENFIVLTLDIAMRADDFGVELSYEGLNNAVVGFFTLFGEEIIETVEKIDEEIIGVVLLVPSKLNNIKFTGPMK